MIHWRRIPSPRIAHSRIAHCAQVLAQHGAMLLQAMRSPIMKAPSKPSDEEIRHQFGCHEFIGPKLRQLNWVLMSMRGMISHRSRSNSFNYKWLLTWATIRSSFREDVPLIIGPPQTWTQAKTSRNLHNSVREWWLIVSPRQTRYTLMIPMDVCI